MEPEKLELNTDTIKALSRECYYNSLEKDNLELLNFIMTEFGKELMKNQFFITPIEIEKMFRLSRDKQKIYRNRVNDPLPYRKEENCRNCDILYETEKVLKWLDRNFPEVMI